jgi:hypothetical protein
VKQSSRALLTSVIVLPCLAIFIFALLNSSNITLSSKTRLTQKAIETRLTNESSKKHSSINKTAVVSKATVASHEKVGAAKPLTNTGPGNILALFVVSTTAGIIAARIYILRLHRYTQP